MAEINYINQLSLLVDQNINNIDALDQILEEVIKQKPELGSWWQEYLQKRSIAIEKQEYITLKSSFWAIGSDFIFLISKLVSRTFVVGLKTDQFANLAYMLVEFDNCHTHYAIEKAFRILKADDERLELFLHYLNAMEEEDSDPLLLRLAEISLNRFPPEPGSLNICSQFPDRHIPRSLLQILFRRHLHSCQRHVELHNFIKEIIENHKNFLDFGLAAGLCLQMLRCLNWTEYTPTVETIAKTLLKWEPNEICPVEGIPLNSPEKLLVFYTSSEALLSLTYLKHRLDPNLRETKPFILDLFSGKLSQTSYQKTFHRIISLPAMLFCFPEHPEATELLEGILERRETNDAIASALIAAKVTQRRNFKHQLLYHFDNEGSFLYQPRYLVPFLAQQALDSIQVENYLNSEFLDGLD